MARKTFSENLFRHFPTLVGYFFLFYCCTAKPTAKNDHVTMSGEPTHFQVDDKAAELEINANAMGVKVNAKPASLQVVSKPGVPSIPVANPAVVVPQLPAPYLPAPFYPSPGLIGPTRTAVRKRHHFFNMDPGMGNWNFKRDSIPRKRTGISKKSEKTKNKNNSKKRQWIQRLPVMTQLMPYPQITNVRVHPLVQQMAALSQGAMRQFISRPYFQTSQPSLQKMNTFGQRFPYTSSTTNLEQNGQARSLVNQPTYTPSPTVAFLPLFNQGLPYPSARAMVPTPLAGYNGYYDPIITRDFIPYLGTGVPHVPLSTPRVIVPGGMPAGINYPGYTPLGMWQRVSKRLIIPRNPTKNAPRTKKISTRNTQEKTTGNDHLIKDLSKKYREMRSVKISQNNKGKASEGNKENVAKRQFIITRPVSPQMPQIMTYVPVVSSPRFQAPVQVASSPLVQAPAKQGMSVAERRNLVLNLPSRTSGTFVLNLPSQPRVPQMYPGDPAFGHMVGAFYKPVVNTGILEKQRNDIGLQRSGIVMQSPESSSRVPLAELAGIQGQPVLQNNRHITMSYNNEQWPSQVEDQLFGGSSVEGRATIPESQRRSSRNRHSSWLDDFEREYKNPEDSDYQPSSYNDESPSARVDDEGSYTERMLPDGRTILKKDHVGFGPITVQAKTAASASRDQDDATDMDLDSDKRKKIARPFEQLDKRLGIPRPKEKK